ncbi:aldo/keto reductase [Oenococcus alcoholitolerans]|uniref:Aldo/keto reductase n=1 Tax=Oenococcus alcoholitolerans TaxID=931074 RepID=A0ABR4XRC0_9LACO|nr:aldo/keto reductase [Oenococcus alcoholitolerans]
MRQEVELSLFKFGIDHEDLLFLHRVDSHFSLAEQMTELKRMQDEGKIRHLGLSQVTVKQIQEAEKYAKIDAVENLYNLANRRDEDVLEYTAAHGIAFVPWFPLNTGRLAQAGGILDKIAKKYQAAPAQIALAWLLKRSPNILPIPGTKSIKHLTENVAAAQIKLSDEDFKKLSDASQF